MEVQEQIRFLSRSEYRIGMLDALDSGPKVVDDLAKRLSVSERTTNRHFTALADLEWAEYVEESLAITSAGQIVLREYQKACGEIRREGLTFLSGGKESTRPLLLRTLARPMTKPELVDECQVSETTVYRAVIKKGGFVDKGWVRKRSDGKYILRDEGADILTAYDKLSHALELVKENNVVLEYLDINPPPPIYVLENSSTKALNLGVAHDGLDRAIDAISNRPTHIRTTARSVSGPLVSLGMQLLENRVELEVVFDEHTLDVYQREYPSNLERSFKTPSVEMYCRPEKFNAQLSIFDDEHLLLGVYDEHGSLVGGIDGTDDKLIAWGVELFERYREEAHPLRSQQVDDVSDDRTLSS